MMEMVEATEEWLQRVDELVDAETVLLRGATLISAWVFTHKRQQ